MVTFDEIWNYVVSQMSTNQFFSAAAFSSVLISVGYYLRRVPNFIWARIYRNIHFSVVIEQESFLYSFILLYIKEHYPNNLRRLEAKGVFSETTLLGKKVEYNQENDTNYFWFKRRRLTVRATKEKLEHAESTMSLFSRTYSISGLFAKKAIQNFIDAALEFGVEYERAQSLKKEKIRILTFDSSFYRNWRELDASKGKTFNDIFLENKEEIMEDLEFFKSQKVVYDKVKVPYKRGYVFYGLPGNGKSALAYAIGDYLKYDIYSVSLSNMRDHDLLKCFMDVPSRSVVLIEDIDSFYDGREPKGENKVSFSAFINMLSGVSQKNEIVTVFTTNKIDCLDPALLRDSRCDFKLEIKNPNKEVIEEYIKNIYGVQVDIGITPNIGFAQLQNLALKSYPNVTTLISLLHDTSPNSSSDHEVVRPPQIVFE